MIKYVLLDVDNTLLDFHECAKNAMKRGCQQHGLTYTDDMFDTFTRINNTLWTQVEDGSLTRQVLYRTRFVAVFESLGINADGAAFGKTFSQYLSTEACPIDGAHDLLAYLADKYTVCAASNADYDRQVSRLTTAGLMPYIDHMFASLKIGCDKPHAGFFDACFQVLKPMSKNEVIIIGDSLTADIRGGIDYGIATCWYNPEAFPAPADCQPDFIVQRLAQIKEIL